MASLQAVVILCDDPRFKVSVKSFLDNTLNLYSTVEKTASLNQLIEASDEQNDIFSYLSAIIDGQGTSQIILISHQDCHAYGGSKSFSSVDEELRYLELLQRHAISILRAKFPSVEISGHIAAFDPSNQVIFKKVI
jgi:hypothetical protein